MSAALLYGVAAAALCALGLYGVLAHAHLLRRIMALNVLGSGVFLLLIAIARRAPQLPPDPVPHAMVLTGIVVAVSTTALALALARRLYTESGRCALPEEDADGSCHAGIQAHVD